MAAHVLGPAWPLSIANVVVTIAILSGQPRLSRRCLKQTVLSFACVPVITKEE